MSRESGIGSRGSGKSLLRLLGRRVHRASLASTLRGPRIGRMKRIERIARRPGRVVVRRESERGNTLRDASGPEGRPPHDCRRRGRVPVTERSASSARSVQSASPKALMPSGEPQPEWCRGPSWNRESGIGRPLRYGLEKSSNCCQRSWGSASVRMPDGSARGRWSSAITKGSARARGTRMAPRSAT